MTEKGLRKILDQLAKGNITPDEAFGKLKGFPAEDVGFANIDHHRAIRQGFPEVIYCEGKTDGQIVTIVKKMIATKNPVLATRATKTVFSKIKKFAKGAVFHEASCAITIEKKNREKKGNILLVSAGTSDIPVAEEAAVTASIMGSKVETLYDVGVAGIHRLFASADKIEKARVIVVVAGMDGALPSVVGGLAPCPVIAVPTSVGYGASFAGLSALLAMLNSCAAGVGVMNIDNGFGAGALAHKINSVPERVEDTNK